MSGVKTITIEIREGKDITLTYEEARKLKTVLDELFPPVGPISYPQYIPPIVVPSLPWYNGNEFFVSDINEFFSNTSGETKND